jgi:prepilin-type N-terminal cleavage/methylation domain-containing protein
MRKQKGFTLIEILIVVVIIAILAALILPRFLAQPEKAVLAEANQMLGAIARAQNVYGDSNNATAGTWVAVASATVADWNKIGMQMPATTNFTYACTASSCTATRGSGNYAACEIDLTSLGAWSVSACPASYQYTCAVSGACKV